MSSLADVLSKYAEHGNSGLLPAVEEIARNGYLAAHLRSLVEGRSLVTNESPVGYRHPNGFTKIKLVGLADSGWALRLHVWNPSSSDRDIHNHRWDLASYVLSGSLVERCYEFTAGPGRWTKYNCSPSVDGRYDLNDPHVCDVRLFEEDVYTSGSSYRRRSDTLHMARAAGEQGPVVTLFAQGAEQGKSTTVVRPGYDTYRDAAPVSLCSDQYLTEMLRMVLNLTSHE